MKTMTRAEMKRAAQALAYYDDVVGVSIESAAKKYRIPVREISTGSPRFQAVFSTREEISILMSEAHRPAGHDGDGKDD